MRFHPANLLLLWFSFLLAFSVRSGVVLILSCFIVMMWAYLSATLHLQRLLRRSIWLMLTLFAVFSWMTPGTPLSLMPFVSVEGLHLAVMQSTRVLLAIASLALVLQYLSRADLVAGMYFFLAPLSRIGVPAKRLAVRLMLTLEEVERVAMPTHLMSESRKVQLADALTLPQYGWNRRDAGAALVSILLIFSIQLP
ncbi:MAG TPA: hypothetical protein VIM43_01455 [Rugosibacter sp.]